jgi:hypothetical protein
VYSLLRTRDAMMRQCKEFNIPTDWMLDNNLISKVNIMCRTALLWFIYINHECALPLGLETTDGLAHYTTSLE